MSGLRYVKSGLYCDAARKYVYVEHLNELEVRFCPHCGAPITDPRKPRLPPPPLPVHELHDDDRTGRLE